MKRLAIALLVLGLSTSAVKAQESQLTALEYLDIAFNAIENADEINDWDTAIINFQRAIDAESNECEADVYRWYMEIAQEVREMGRTESSLAGLHQYWTLQSSEVDGDCGY